MKRFFRYCILLAMTMLPLTKIIAKGFRVAGESTLFVSVDTTLAPIVSTAYEIMTHDFEQVLDVSIMCTNEMDMTPDISVTQGYVGHPQGFRLNVTDDGVLQIIGSDNFGMAYGMLEVSRLLGVSPWTWWADAGIPQKDEFLLPQGYDDTQWPSVEFRGISISDEELGFLSWASVGKSKDNSGRSTIGSGTYARVLELLLRLRANCLWPAMGEKTSPFFLSEDNLFMAEKYGIYIGTPPTQPMSTSLSEWKDRGQGDYDYTTNRDVIREFWKNRTEQVRDLNIIYTLGFTSPSSQPQTSQLQQIIADQREIISSRRGLNQTPQVFSPFSHQLSSYDQGLSIPDDVCLLWTDDNFGNILRYPSSAEQSRKGGNGLIFHLSQKGAPKDNLWLSAYSPSQMISQLTQGYNHGLQRIWVLGAGSIKPLEYSIELFLDLAWNIGRTQVVADTHLQSFLQREFGERTAAQLLPVVKRHYDLVLDIKPEFLGGEPVNVPDQQLQFFDLPYSDDYLLHRIDDCLFIEQQIEKISADIPQQRQDEFLQLVRYPLLANAAINKKCLYAQLARHTGYATGDYWEKSDSAYQQLVVLTRTYNRGINNEGKWNKMIDTNPRVNTLFGKIERNLYYLPKPITDNSQELFAGLEPLAPDASRTFTLTASDNPVTIEVRVIPQFPATRDGALRLSITTDGETSSELHFETTYFSPQWQQNILRNYSSATITLPSTPHRITLTALDEGIILRKVLKDSSAISSQTK